MGDLQQFCFWSRTRVCWMHSCSHGLIPVKFDTMSISGQSQFELERCCTYRTGQKWNRRTLTYYTWYAICCKQRDYQGKWFCFWKCVKRLVTSRPFTVLVMNSWRRIRAVMLQQWMIRRIVLPHSRLFVCESSSRHIECQSYSISEWNWDTGGDKFPLFARLAQLINQNMQCELCTLSFSMYVCVCVSSWEGWKRSVCERVDVSR